MKLKFGDTIGYYSPSAPATFFAPIRYKRAQKFLESKGFKLISGNLSEKSEGYRSGSIIERANELNALIENTEVKCIMSTIGGNNSNSILPFLNFDEIKKNPKIFIGYSDVTAILLGIYAKTGIVTFYGPALVASFGEFSPLVDETFSYFSDILIDNLNLPYTFKFPDRYTDEFINCVLQLFLAAP
ncbi:MAG: LD-carboxypeptidase [Cetobacterium sp.]